MGNTVYLTILMNLFIGPMYVKNHFMNIHNMATTQSTPVLWATLFYFFYCNLHSAVKVIKKKKNQEEFTYTGGSCCCTKDLIYVKCIYFDVPWTEHFGCRRSCCLWCYSIFVHRLMVIIVHISHHIRYSLTPSEDLITHRFVGFTNDQYSIGCHVTSRFIASALPLS